MGTVPDYRLRAGAGNRYPALGAGVRTQYAPVVPRTKDEVVRTGIVAEQDGASVTLVDAKGEKTRIDRDRIDSICDLSTSPIPEKLLDALTPQERRDLFRHLQPVPPK